ncbi:MAG: hypothetical protein ABEI86_07595 [Halobacteriaceae archaeon]
MRISRQASKISLITLLFVVSYFTFKSALLPNRATTDEAYVINDLFVLLSSGHLTEPAYYWNGNGYQFISVTILRITGLGYSSLEWLSPLLGGLILGLLGVVATVILHEYLPREDYWAAPVFLLSIGVFGGFLLRFSESTHKRFTFALIFILFLLVFRQIIASKHQRRHHYMIFLIGFAIALFNIIWAMVYLTPIILILVISQTQLSTEKLAVSIVLFFSAVFSLAAYVPTIRIPAIYTLKVLAPFLTGTKTYTVTQTTLLEGGIAGWGPLTIAGFTFSSWFIWASGIMFVVLISAVAFLRAVIQTFVRRSNTEFEVFYLCLSGWFGAMAVMLIALGDMATFKRVVVLPAAFSSLYAFYSVHETTLISPQTRRVFMTVLVAGLLIGSVLAVPRTTLNGDRAPYDVYADGNDIKKVQWYDDYKTENGCLQSHQYIDPYISAEIFGPSDPNIIPVSPSQKSSKVYASGGKSYLSCDGRS